MSRHDVDLEELLKFQLRSLAFCDHMVQLSELLSEAVNAASSELRDDISKKALSGAADGAARLQIIGRKNGELMAAYVRKTKHDIKIWNELDRK